MIDRLLIANRGEIACRIIRTCRRLGIATVAVHSDADAGALHVRMADRAVAIGGAAPADSYLRGDRIIAAAQETGAQAIHPGYGFLSENADFAAAVEDAGLIFVGPTAASIRAMGLKDAAKAAMEAAGVPVVPGYHGAGQDDALLAEEAARIGYPVLIKAVAGGGGKGMRRVETAADFPAALASARGEAARAFGNDAVLIEKWIDTPRHIEVQVFGDGSRAVHLYERDCSLQRRHQKVIEEAPAPGMTEAVRAAMTGAAVRAAEAIGYRGAGTVEFIVDGSGGLRADGFWFMEMNTRLQVEHPVTEAVTGIDLVEWQIRVAAGAPIPLRQDEIALCGHAVEARLYAEDAPAGFLPATGPLHHLRFADGVRADSGVETGDAVTPHYDPMIAKLIAAGADRAVAFAALSAGLKATEVAGVTTNLGFLSALVDHPAVQAGAVETGLIGRDLAALTAAPGATAGDLAQAALILSDLWDDPPDHAGFALWTPLAFPVDLGGAGTVRLSPRADGWDAHTPAGPVACSNGPGGGWRLNGTAARRFHRAGRTVTLFGGAPLILTLADPLAAGAAGAAGGDTVLAPMPGRVVSVAVGPGAEVAAGQRLMTLEAMKMEHVLTAPRAGVLAEIAVAAGAQVAAGDLLARLAPEAETRPAEADNDTPATPAAPREALP